MDHQDHLRAALADRYEIERDIGSGGMATVYLAEDLKHRRKVAVKVLRQEFAVSLGAERFVREIEIAANLTHPHILPLFDSGDASGLLFYVMPYIEGESLRERLYREKKLPLSDAVRITDQVASALTYAHERGVVHRDIKPENILLTGDQAIVADFGIARAVEAAGGHRITGTGIAVGTPAYMSPEQAAGEKEVSGSTDVYALGCVLYEMVSGRAPFRASNARALVVKHIVDAPPSLATVDPDIPLFVDRALSKALAKEPARRFGTPRDFAATLTSQTVVPPEGKSIVVLPFENMNPDSAHAYFADGLTEELIADLSRVRALHVISRTSAMLLKGSRKDVPTIASELNVRYVLEGSVRWAGDNLRITAQLIEAATHMHVWGDKYSGTLEDVFDLQEQMSRRIVTALKVNLAPDEDRHLAGRDVPDVEAHALCLRARQELQKFSEESLDLAEQLLQRAMDRTGPNGHLLAVAAEVEMARYDMGYSPVAETLHRADAMATEALALDPDSAEAHVVKSLVASKHSDVRACVRHALKAVDLDPGNAMAAWGAAYTLALVGRSDEAREHGERAYALDPLWWPAPFGACLADLCDGRFDSAVARMVRAHNVSGVNPAADLWLGVFLTYAGREEEAAEPLDRVAGAGAGSFSAAAAFLRSLATRDREAMHAALDDPEVRVALEGDTEFSWMIAAGLTAVGDREEALRWLSIAIDRGFLCHRFFAEIDPHLAGLRGDPGFEELMERAREMQLNVERGSRDLTDKDV
jgi:serine/threonine-protein kinase